MRLKVLLLLALLITISLTLFPDVAHQTLIIEAFGWQFETKQGAFVVSLLLILAIFWLIRRIITALLAGPGQLWQTLRIGGHKRREERLRDGIAQWLDMRGDYGQRIFKKSRGIIPEWARHLLILGAQTSTDQVLASPSEDKLATVLAARIATDPNATSRPDIATRKAHLEAWLQAHPNAPLALMRMADLTVEEGDWKQAVKRLEEVWKHGYRSAAYSKPKLAQAWLALANQEPQHAMEHLRKAYRMNPSDSDVALALGEHHLQNNNTKAAKKFWLAHLEREYDLPIANAAYDLLKDEALDAFHKLESRESSAALQWLKARLAHAGKLDGLADEILAALIQESPCSEFWQTQAEWLMEKEQWDEAKHAYQQALTLARD